MKAKCVTVYNLATGEELVYVNQAPRDAVRLAYAFEKGLISQLSVHGLAAIKDIPFMETKIGYYCGDWAVKK